MLKLLIGLQLAVLPFCLAAMSRVVFVFMFKNKRAITGPFSAEPTLYAVFKFNFRSAICLNCPTQIQHQ